MNQHEIKTPFVIFIGDQDVFGYAKTGLGLVQWRRDDCAAQVRLTPSAVDLGLPDANTGEVIGKARALVIGTAPRGGVLPDHWIPHLCDAARAGIDIVAGLHVRLNDVPTLVEAAAQGGALLWDVRVPPANLPIGTGNKRTGKRLLTVGTDCAAGKKYTALSIAQEMQRRGISSDFRATGQTGIMIAGTGIPIDAVVSDFIAGAAETLSPDNAQEHWDIVEGQGSLFHPSYAGVSLGLLHGSQPDAIVMCHPAARNGLLGLEDFSIPTIRAAIARNLEAGRLTNPAIQCVGVSINSTGLSAEEAAKLKAEISGDVGLPCIDPLLDGPGAIVDRLLEQAR